ncbi:MAG: hypothetical protein H6828_00350 [Planctomycetes bacterium]|nr:hypothetical protein [Planctomycetota bacterium]
MLEESPDTFHPRVLDVDLGGEPLVARRLGALAPDAVLDPLERLGGSALALARCLRAARARGEVPLVIAVGDAVRRGLPTAARAAVAGVAPLGGRYVDGQVGGDLARRLASLADALVLRGACAPGGAVLVLAADGAAHLERVPELAALDVPARARAAARALRSLRRSLSSAPRRRRTSRTRALANLADPPSYVGRGGLGARFARTGLAALVVRAAPVEALRGGRGAARGAGALAAARRPRRGRHARDGRVVRGRRRPRARARARARGRGPARCASGLACAGCPTACRHVLAGANGARQGVRFSATHLLGEALALDFAASRALLGVCDAVGVDAREAGAALALLADARARARGARPGAAR